MDKDCHTHDDAMEAIRVCLGCDVKTECLQLCAEDPFAWRHAGVWGGTTPKTRQKWNRLEVLGGNFDFSILDKPLVYLREFAAEGLAS